MYLLFQNYRTCLIISNSTNSKAEAFAVDGDSKFLYRPQSSDISARPCLGWRKMSMGSDTGSTWVGKKPLRRIGGMSDALSIAADLGFSVAPPPSQVPISLIAHMFFEFFAFSFILSIFV